MNRKDKIKLTTLIGFGFAVLLWMAVEGFTFLGVIGTTLVIFVMSLILTPKEDGDDYIDYGH